jgi:head-tail adaptor
MNKLETNPFIGQMDKKIEVIEFTSTQNETGEDVRTETVIANPFAYLREISGNEDVDGKVRHLINRSYTIRYNATVLQKANSLAVRDRGMLFQVIHVKEFGRKKHLEILVKFYE